jgi:hypothetical protein
VKAENLPQVQYKNREGPALRKLLASGERRLEYLDDVIGNERGSQGSLAFDKAERLFVRAGLKALELNHAMISRETNPLTALRDLVAEIDALQDAEMLKRDKGYGPLVRVANRCKRLLRELGALG